MRNSISNLFNTKTIPLLALVGVIVFMGASSIYHHDGSAHWMEGPGIAILVVFMPLTAISFLHFRLPEKQEEFATIKKMLQTDIDVSESFAVIMKQDNSGSGYLLPISFVTFFSVLGFYILLSGRAVILFNGMEWVDHGSSLMRDISHSAITEYISRFDTYNYRRGVVAAGMSFLGAYIWSIQYLFRRMITLDLPPGVYYSIGSRMIYSVFLAVVLQHFMSGENSASEYFLENQLIPISFLVGIFPESSLLWLKESFGRIFQRRSLVYSPLPLEMIEGISGLHKARLAELGIDNVQNMAHASLIELILKTPFRPRVLIDWMAQARLCIEFKESTPKLRRAGVRTIFDLLNIAEDKELLKSISDNSGIEISLIRTVCKANINEKSIEHLRQSYDVLNMV